MTYQPPANAGHSPDALSVADVARCGRLMRLAHAVFVFGSNRHGRHGKGAALVAKQRYGAKQGQGEGRMGRCYALPTKEDPYHTLSLSEVAMGVERLLAEARRDPQSLFVVSRLGCGLAGFTDAQIAPLFTNAPSNCALPDLWCRMLQRTPFEPPADRGPAQQSLGF